MRILMGAVHSGIKLFKEKLNLRQEVAKQFKAKFHDPLWKLRGDLADGMSNLLGEKRKLKHAEALAHFIAQEGRGEEPSPVVFRSKEDEFNDLLAILKTAWDFLPAVDKHDPSFLDKIIKQCHCLCSEYCVSQGLFYALEPTHWTDQSKCRELIKAEIQRQKTGTKPAPAFVEEEKWWAAASAFIAQAIDITQIVMQKLQKPPAEVAPAAPAPEPEVQRTKVLGG
jgi:hypothetical protein